ncbi:serine/threonine-protein phosphatase with EF-hands 2 isoform X2 [Brachyhypopomus gauderio]|uniref:serine/threonine-protein phosphatase with EF-hands 2 isoform X2 n=1 Tax=Brachyhypopomus gauderio TaxID=698409 RepID=UPI004041D45D
MGCGVSKGSTFHKRCDKAFRAAVLIQRWHQQYVARVETRRRYAWNIFQSIEYAGQQDQIKLYNFLGYLMDNFTPCSSERNLVCRIFREHEVCGDVEWERYFSHSGIEVPDVYTGPRLRFPLDAVQAAALVEAFRNKQLHSHYVLQILLETWKLLRSLPNINRISTCQSKEVTVCGDLHGQLEDLLLIFYKNGLPSLEKPYVFNGDFVDRGKDSIEILLILFAFLLVYPGEVHLNRGNHEDHIINMRYGFTKEVLGKYKMHGKRILKLLRKIFSWLPLATVIDQKVLIVHGGVSDTTDLALLARVDRHRYVSALRPPKRKGEQSVRSSVDSAMDEDLSIFMSRRRASRTQSRAFPCRSGFHSRSSQDFGASAALNLQQGPVVPGGRGGSSLLGYSMSYTHFRLPTAPESDSDCTKDSHNVNDEWKQILDLLWSDPMGQDGCIPNDLRGGGCHWGPDVTEDFLNRHNLNLIIRSHECKQDGYEFCHDRKVLTIFSASNYYEVGSNRGAFVRLGPDLVPYVIQYQANCRTREISASQSVGRTERSALKVLREQLFVHKSDLISAFQEYDKKNTGLISLRDWGGAVGQVLLLDLPWRRLRSQLALVTNAEGMLDYHTWFRRLAVPEPGCKHIEQTLLETLYRHRSTLETIFRIVDTDNSGLISFEDFHQTWKLLSAFLKTEISDEAIHRLVVSTDTNKDGRIDIDEFMESFRLVDKNRLENGQSFTQRSEDHGLKEEELSSTTPDSHLPITSTMGELLIPPP